MVRDDGALHQLGCGELGVAYLAQHADLKSLVALKVLTKEQAGDEVIRRRFLDEAHALAGTDRDGLAESLQCGEAVGGLWYAAELCDDGHLKQCTAGAGELDDAAVFHLMLQGAVAKLAALSDELSGMVREAEQSSHRCPAITEEVGELFRGARSVIERIRALEPLPDPGIAGIAVVRMALETARSLARDIQQQLPHWQTTVESLREHVAVLDSPGGGAGALMKTLEEFRISAERSKEEAAGLKSECNRIGWEVPSMQKESRDIADEARRVLSAADDVRSLSPTVSDDSAALSAAIREAETSSQLLAGALAALRVSVQGLLAKAGSEKSRIDATEEVELLWNRVSDAVDEAMTSIGTSEHQWNKSAPDKVRRAAEDASRHSVEMKGLLDELSSGSHPDSLKAIENARSLEVLIWKDLKRIDQWLWVFERKPSRLWTSVAAVMAFLFCFAGGMTLGPKPDDSSAESAVMANAEEESRMTGEIENLKNEFDKWGLIRDSITAAEPELKKENEKLLSIRKREKDPAVAKFKEAHGKLKEAYDQRPMESDGKDFLARIEWWRRFDAADKKYKELKAASKGGIQ